ncbi:MAG: hypothetical protein H0U40_02810, partial [Chloroflexia bacterium]|nr:hypothetical protein [Chloroflexia bacterium]
GQGLDRSGPVTGSLRPAPDTTTGAVEPRGRSRPAPWSADPGAAPIEVPVRSERTERSDRSTRADGRPYVIPAPAAPPPAGRYFDWNAPASEVVTSRDSRRRRGWWGRLTGILLVLLSVTVVGVMLTNRTGDDQRPPRTEVAAGAVDGDIATRDPAPAGGETGTRPANPETAVAIGVGGEGSLTPSVSPDQAVPSAPATEVPTGESGAGPDPVTPAGGPVDDDLPAEPAAADDDPPTSTPRPTSTTVPPTSEAGPDPTRTPTPGQRSADRPGDGTDGDGGDLAGAGAEEEVSAATIASTATPAVTRAAPTSTTIPPTATSAPVDPPASTSAPVDPPAATTATPVPPTVTVAPSPTRAPRPSAAPTVIPPSLAPPTATEVVPEPTETPLPPTETPAPPTETPEPPAETPEPLFPEQAATVDGERYTAPVMGAGAFRVTVESTTRGASLPTLGLPTNPYGDWLVAIVLMENWSDAPANLIMADFGLVTAAPFVGFQPLDSGTGIVGSSLGFSTVLGSADVAVVPPGEERRVSLLFTADRTGTGFSLRYGLSVMGLESSLTTSPDPPDLGAPARTPVLLAATVTGIIDGATIEVEADGAVARVRYAALSAPGEDACYGPEATDANSSLVEIGETVYLERQATGEDEDGTLVRDVWLARDGGLTLAGQSLAEAGALDVLADSPDARYLDWLQLTVSEASFLGLGRWGACGTAATDGTTDVANAGAATVLRYVAAGLAATLPNPPRA